MRERYYSKWHGGTTASLPGEKPMARIYLSNFIEFDKQQNFLVCLIELTWQLGATSACVLLLR
jgi:hypothetical protein